MWGLISGLSILFQCSEGLSLCHYTVFDHCTFVAKFWNWEVQVLQLCSYFLRLFWLFWVLFIFVLIFGSVWICAKKPARILIEIVNRKYRRYFWQPKESFIHIWLAGRCSLQHRPKVHSKKEEEAIAFKGSGPESWSLTGLVGTSIKTVSMCKQEGGWLGL